VRRIDLAQVSMQRFRSFHAATIDLSVAPGLKFIGGDNKTQPRLGANGAGKSTLWDAAVFALTGRSVKGLRAADLVTWGEKQPQAGAYLMIDDELVDVIRQGSPDRLTLQGLQVEQATVDRAMGLTRLRLLHAVIFGQGVPLFIDLSMPERAALLDEVLDLQIWLDLSAHAARKEKDARADMDKIDNDISFAEGKLAGMPSADNLQARADEWDTQQDQRVERAIDDVEKEEKRADDLRLKDKMTEAAYAATPKLDQRRKGLDRMREDKARLEADYRALFKARTEAEQVLAFYKKNKVCPTCRQKIDANNIVQHVRKHGADLDRIQADLALSNNNTVRLTESINREENDYNKELRKVEFLRDKWQREKAEAEAQDRVIQGAAAVVERLADEPNPFLADIEKLEADRAALTKAIRALHSQKRRAGSAVLQYEFWVAAYKRVRLFEVRRVLQQLEIESAAAALSLGLVGWRIEFATETETKSGTLRPGVQIIVHSPQASAIWEAWSGGEAQRIKLAVAIGMSNMIQRAAGVQFGFEVWDEPTAWLSDLGIEDLLTMLKHRADITQKSIWVCDHRALAHGAFDEVWIVSKTEQGSAMALVSKAE